MTVIRGKEVSLVDVEQKETKPKTVKNDKNTSSSNKHSTNGTQTSTYKTIKCWKCGKTHEMGKCPAKGTTCKYCKKPDHWLKVCRKRLSKINIVQDSDSNESQDDQSDNEILYIKKTEPINHIYAVGEDKWITKLKVHNESMNFRIDTGAKCCITTKVDFDKFNNIKLEKLNKTLKSYSNHHIKPLGAVKLTVSYNDIFTEVKFEIVDLVQENIISGDVAEKLGLLRRVNSVDTAEEELTRDFPELIKKLGRCQGNIQ